MILMVDFILIKIYFSCTVSFFNKENGFVKTEDLENLMNSLDLLTDKE